MLQHISKQQPKTPLDYLLYFFVFTTPLFEIPQATIIYTSKNADGVSILTWAYFAISSMAWLAYGWHKKLRPVIFAYSLYLVIEIIIVIGIFRYG